jgi:hypothetical protein
VEIRKLRNDQGKIGYFSKDLEWDKQWGMARPQKNHSLLLALCSSILVGSSLCIISSRSDSLLSIFIGLSLLRLASLLWSFALFGFFTTHATDETHYFQIAQKLMNWELSFSEYPYTLAWISHTPSLDKRDIVV